MGKRILVADDSRTIQQAFAMVMDGSGYTLSFAKSVDEALSVAKRDGHPDLVLSDAMLGSGSGYDLCAQLKADASLRDVPVYILASLQTPYDEARGRKVGADGHLAKPFESQALLDAVASALATPARRPAAAVSAHGIDFGTSPSRYGEDEVVGEEEESYGEITIERGPTAPGPSGWAARPPTKPSGARPLPTAPTPGAPAQAAPRAPMIGGPRPTTGVPATRTGTTPPPSPGLPPPSAPLQPRQPARTMMGFPTPKSSTGARPAGFPAPIAPPVVAPSIPTPSRPATMPPATALPGRPPTFPAPAAPVVAKPVPPGVTLPGPAPAAPVRPVPRFTPPPAASVPPVALAQPQPTTRRTLTPPLPAAAPGEPPQAIAAAVASVADKIDQKVAALAERGPEYEAIAKLSREIIEQVVWEVVPELAEAIIRQQVDRLASAKK